MRRRESRQLKGAARVVYAELVQSAAAVGTLLHRGDWTHLVSAPRRTAWEAHAAVVVSALTPDEVGTIPRAYSALDDLVYVFRDERYVAQDDFEHARKQLLDVRAGLSVLARLTGWKGGDVAKRDVVPALLAQLAPPKP